MIIAIDLGTTNSLVGIWQQSQAVLIPNSIGKLLTPSVVSVDTDDTILVGQVAKERLISHPQLTASVFKRYMGSQKKFRLGQQTFSSEELSALVLKSLKADAEAYLKQNVTQAVITVPAYFNELQREATKNAAQMAGLSVARLLNEPTAAAMAYGLHNSSADSQFLVLDLGGGTFDVTLLELFSGIMEVRASAGDNQLGGEDFTQLLFDGFVKHCQVQTDSEHLPPNEVNQTQKSSLFSKHQNQVESNHNQLEFWQPYQSLLFAEAEKCKRQLSQENRASMSLSVKKVCYVWHITEQDFATLCQRLLQRFKDPIERTVRDAKLRIKALDEVILVGGATRMPIFRQLMTRLMGRFPSINLNPEQTIAIGAAIQAGLVAEDAALDEVILTDVAPYSLGVDTVIEIKPKQYQDGIFAPIIERNTVIPTSKVHTFYPIDDKQTQVQFNIYQGEARLTKDNIKLGEMSIDIPTTFWGKATKLPIDVRFSYDVNGLLEVDIAMTDSEKNYNLVIENGAKQLSDKQILQSKNKLQALKIHPRDQAENRTLLARAERLYAQRLGFEREQLARLIGWYESVLDSQDVQKIRHANSELNKSLDLLEQDDWL